MRISHYSVRSVTTRCLFAGLLFSTAIGFAQNPGWRRADEPAPSGSVDPSTPVAQPDQDNLPPANQSAGPYAGALPPSLTIPAGKFLTVRVNEPLSSNHNQVGDFFTATLVDPIVVDGVVVAQRGQTVSGRVSQLDKGGRVSGVAKLGVQLTELTAVDGQQLPIQTQLVGRNARATTGRDAAAVATTTGVGAVIGAAAGWGRGAAIGAGAGAVIGLAGVLLTRGAPAIVYPETLLSFRVETPVNISTERAPQAFRYVDPNEYQGPPVQTRVATGPPPYGAAPYPYAYAPYWGPGFGVFIGPRWGGYYGYRGGFGYRGFRR
jgi:hypothetical protein